MICKICHKDARRIWCKYRYDIYLCENCSFKFIYPDPTQEELERVYENTNYVNDIVIGGNANILRIVRTQSEIDLIAKLRPEGNLLDCGSGDGMAVSYAQKVGLNTIGIEMSGFLTRQSIEKYGIQVFNTDFMNYNSRPAQFDVIRMKSYIEHLTDPILHLKKAYDLLKENGILILITEDYDSFDARKHGVDWDHIIPPVHLSYFSKKSMRLLLFEAGFKGIIINDRGFPKYTHISKYPLVRNNPVFLYFGLFFHMNPFMTVYAAKSQDVLRNFDSFKLGLFMTNHLHLNLFTQLLQVIEGKNKIFSSK